MDLGKIDDEQVAAAEEMSQLVLSAQEHLNEIDVKILIDLFYLPFEYGSYAIYLLKEFNNLKADFAKLRGETKNVSNSILFIYKNIFIGKLNEQKNRFISRPKI
jgi:hypothetical protein